MAELTRVGRVRLQANRSRVYGPATIPNAGYTKMRISVDLTDADQVDPTAVLSWTVEKSLDAGASWAFVAGATTYGSTSPERQALLLDAETARPWVEFACPPAGAQIRATVQTAAKPMDVGFILEAWV